MKKFFLGLLIGLLTIALPVKAVEATLSIISVHDLFAASIMSGLIARNVSSPNEEDMECFMDKSFKLADKMLEKRNK